MPAPSKSFEDISMKKKDEKGKNETG
jgi:hypothetical protein